MTHATLPPEGVERLLAADPARVYIDVRTVEEFEAGHVPGSYNIPIFFKTGMGMQPNPQFEALVKRHFRPEQELVFGCRSGVRSERACELFTALGYGKLVNMSGGFEGSPDQPGWRACGLATTCTAEPGRSYRELVERGS